MREKHLTPSGKFCHPVSPSIVLRRRGQGQVMTGQAGANIRMCDNAGGRTSCRRPHAARMKIATFLPALLPLLLLLQRATALYYKPRPLVCPVTQDVEYVDETLEATEVEVLTTPFVVSKVTLNTVFQSLPLPVTSVALHTVTAEAPLLEVTEVRLVRVTVPLTAVKVSTVTLEVMATSVSFFTVTATNYVSAFQTLSAYKTQHATATTLETVQLATTVTLQSTSVSTITATEGALRTSRVVSSVHHTVTAATDTQIETRTAYYTHTLTKMVTSTICLASRTV